MVPDAAADVAELDFRELSPPGDDRGEAEALRVVMQGARTTLPGCGDRRSRFNPYSIVQEYECPASAGRTMDSGARAS
jgi:hypothetical protein